jgi:hypothetical protein
MATYCTSCGKAGVKWPKHAPEVCSMKCAANAFTCLPETSEAKLCSYCGNYDGFHPEGCRRTQDGYSKWEAIEYRWEWGTVKAYGVRHGLRFVKEADTHEELLAAFDEAEADPGVVNVRAFQPYDEEGGA